MGLVNPECDAGEVSLSQSSLFVFYDISTKTLSQTCTLHSWLEHIRGLEQQEHYPPPFQSFPLFRMPRGETDSDVVDSKTVPTSTDTMLTMSNKPPNMVGDSAVDGDPKQLSRLQETRETDSSEPAMPSFASKASINSDFFQSVDNFLEKNGFSSQGFAEFFRSRSGGSKGIADSRPQEQQDPRGLFLSGNSEDMQAIMADFLNSQRAIVHASDETSSQDQQAVMEAKKQSFLEKMKSTDWLSEYAPTHVDVDPKLVFSSDPLSENKPGASSTIAVPSTSAMTSSGQTDWNQLYLSSLTGAKPPDRNSKKRPLEGTSPFAVPLRMSSRKTSKTSSTLAPLAPATAPVNRKRGTKKATKKQKYDPDSKNYFEPTDLDVLLGRGGRTNHHPGNKLYLEVKEEIQPRYLAALKTDKTAISQELVDRVHDWGGKFLQLDESNNRWFEVTNIKARKKASQTLRELNTPEIRAQKREKYT